MIELYESSADRYADMNSGKLDATISTNVAAKDILEDLNAANAKIQQSDWYYNEKVYLKYYGKTSASAAGFDICDRHYG
ncbi:MAG: hypothetical protein ACI4EH_09225 [Oliverpabstia sp.]